MKILFISSGNSILGISSLIKRQGESLQNNGVEVEYFTIYGKGMFGYLSNYKKLKKKIRQFNPDILHAHYSLSGFLATLTFRKPIVVSLMGSDINLSAFVKFVTKFLCKYVWSKTIVKSYDMSNKLLVPNVIIIPNGVDINLFKPLKKDWCCEQLSWMATKKHFLFAANPDRAEKNFVLVKNSLDLLNDVDYELHTLSNVSHSDVPIMMNAADVIILTSLWEGSPNVIKEGMACNRPIVSTDVGDVRWVFGDVKGCFISGFNPTELKEKLLEALEFSSLIGSTNGRERLIELGLDSKSVAQRIVGVYNQII